MVLLCADATIHCVGVSWNHEMPMFVDCENSATEVTRLPRIQSGSGERLTPWSVLRVSVAAVVFCLAGGWAVADEGDTPGLEVNPFTFADLIRFAHDCASRPFEPAPAPSVPEADKLTYVEYRGIDCRADRAIWRSASTPFDLQLYHCGYLFPQPVAISTLDGEAVKPIPFSENMFTYATNEIARKARASPGFAGLRIHAPDKTGKSHEILSFLGASYFRGAPLDGSFGTSARGLAVNTGLPEPEEFPAFRAFWIAPPPPEGTTVRLYALLNGPSVAGAYQFDCRLSDETSVAVEAHLFFRNAVKRIGFAPLTSEFFYGEILPPREPDPKGRPEVHDCDGLLLAAGNGEWTWRPLSNPTGIQLDSYAIDSPRGFGLLQRDRDARHYGDKETSPELRSNVWVEPVEGFGSGAVELYRFPTPGEWEDNISAFWAPSQIPKRGQEYRVRYVLHFTLDEPAQHRGGIVSKTVRKVAGADSVHYVVEFAGIRLSSDRPASEIEGVVTANDGRIANVRVTSTHDGSVLQLSFDVNRSTGASVTLRAFLRSGADALSETWTDTWEA